MEFVIGKEQRKGVSANKQSKFKERAKDKNKFVGVRQRPSGKYVAEIKDTIRKIRMWLGTFETAEEAARAYDEAARLLRGSNTRTNFTNRVPTNSHLSIKIRNLLNHKKKTSKPQTNLIATPRISPPSCPIPTNGHNNPHYNISQASSLAFDDGSYRPDVSSCVEGPVFLGQFPVGFDPVPVTHHEGVDLTRGVDLSEEVELSLSEFERVKIERQISASLYANGENWGTCFDGSDAAFWDVSAFYQLFCNG